MHPFLVLVLIVFTGFAGGLAYVSVWSNLD
jgi:hypothetical protein